MITVIGAGLAGLATAYRLEQAGHTVTILEAGSSIGGRIQPVGIESSHQDLGPTWVWPHAQPIIVKWLNELELQTFDQFDEGDAMLDQSAESQAIPYPLPSQYGSTRIHGGTYALIRALQSKLKQSINLNHVVKQCRAIEQDVNAQVANPDVGANNSNWLVQLDNQPDITTDKLIVATPPRMAAQLFERTNTELKSTLNTLDTIETWMAPHAKIVVLFKEPFWRQHGLSGRIASHIGPLAEVHDHSGPEGQPAALFGFSGVPAEMRFQNKEAFIDAIADQLKRCFGEASPAPIEIIVKDWAYEPFVATDRDRRGSGQHPSVAQSGIRKAHCNDSLWFAASETAAISPGLIEGALARADEISARIISNA